jgi:hypothetical protein
VVVEAVSAPEVTITVAFGVVDPGSLTKRLIAWVLVPVVPVVVYTAAAR